MKRREGTNSRRGVSFGMLFLLGAFIALAVVTWTFHESLPSPATSAQQHGSSHLPASLLNARSLRGWQSNVVPAAPPLKADNIDIVSSATDLNATAASGTQRNKVDERRNHAIGGSRAFRSPPCPPTPPPNYPEEYPILDVTSNWNPDETAVPARHFASLCRFDYETELEVARAYRRAEVPFIVSNIPVIEKSVSKWADLDYLRGKLTKSSYLAEYSSNNHFMYFSGSRGPSGWKPPIENRHMSFSKWLDFSKRFDEAFEAARNRPNESRVEVAEQPHYYLRTNSMESGFVSRDLPVLTPSGDKDSFFIVDTRAAKGIHCRFGSRGINAAAHFDGSRNFVAIMRGLRRYMIASPKNCEFMHLFPHGHPSGRHSEVDWSDPDLKKFPNFPKTKASEVILSPGDFMYIPSGWVHYVMSLNTNFQCNARSGKSVGRIKELHRCGF